MQPRNKRWTLKYGNYIKEIYLDRDTRVALLSNSSSEVPEDGFTPTPLAIPAALVAVRVSDKGCWYKGSAIVGFRPRGPQVGCGFTSAWRASLGGRLRPGL